MRRSPALAVDTSKLTNATPAQTMSQHDLIYELNVSPRSSLDSIITTTHDLKHLPLSTEEECQPTSPPPQPTFTPSIRLLFSLLSRRHLILLVTPAIISSLIAGGVAPFMTYVVGQAFDAFAQFPLTPNPPQSAKDTLLHGVGFAALELVGLAVGSLAMGSITSCLWIWTGEVNVMMLRKRVYWAVTGKDMVWFDSHMGGDGTVQATEEGNTDGPVGAGGLMAKFARETDDVRMATSLSSGMIIQYLTTCITCLLLAFLRSWALTLVILSSVPLLMFVQALSQGLANPLLAHERQQTGISATIIDRAIAAIATVKAFNASALESTRAEAAFLRLRLAAKRINTVWGFTSGVAQFVMMSMFVQGFWFGSKLVREGKISAGDVMAVFWACLIATSNLQMCVPQFITLAKGKFAMASLLTLAGDAPSAPPAAAPSATPFSPSSAVPFTPATLTTFSHAPVRTKSRTLRKISPPRCVGELALHNITFAYPSRPTMPVLQDLSLFLPANELTFIVGSSGSGKSTVAQLLLRMYDPQSGSVCLDEQDVRFLDETWMREHVAGVGQQGGAGVVVIDGASLYDNIALALSTPEEPERRASKEAVEDACRAALMSDFVHDLPMGYETPLGTGGFGFSGGQKQRLEIARAKLRNPAILILDEATSALDPTSRILVFEAMKRWRQNKTTIVITHDLSQIEAQDFVYVLKGGRMVEQGYRYDLEDVVGCDNEGEQQGKGEFRKMMESQQLTGGFLPEKDISPSLGDDEGEETEEEEEEERAVNLKHQSLAFRPLTFGNWMFDVVADLTGSKGAAAAPANTTTVLPTSRESRRMSRYSPSGRFAPTMAPPPLSFAASRGGRRPRSFQLVPQEVDLPASPVSAHTVVGRRFSLQFTPTTATFSHRRSTMVDTLEEKEFTEVKSAMEKSGDIARQGRGEKRTRARWDLPLTAVTVDSKEGLSTPSEEHLSPLEDNTHPPFWALMRTVFPTVPDKPYLFLGLVVCVLSGTMTPIFSFVLSRLLFEVSIGARDVSTINRFGGIVLGIAAIDGLLFGTKYFVMETIGMKWVTQLRTAALKKVLAQDKKWFDRPMNTPSRLVQILVKDGDDARNLISVVWAQFCVVTTMLGVGLIWALIRGWELTLAGFAIAPIFAITMAVQTKLVSGCEVKNKRAREEVAREYYDAIINVRGIRCMAFDPVFKSRFDAAADKALTTGVRGALVEGCTYGLSSGLIYLAEALLFYIGAVLIAKERYTYFQMIEVLNLVVFSVSVGSQLMGFTDRIAKSVQAASDFHKLMTLDTDTDESKGALQPDLSGPIHFHNVGFSYPERVDAQILKEVNLEILPGECIAVVGSSGSGKSTIASLLQRLYEPTDGYITVGYNDLRSVDVKHLRENVSVVSQHPNLFDASIAENIRYGDPKISEVDIRTAAKAANAHEFVMELPHGYDTLVGENASLISGGQAQRLQIARALARPSRILILDECTSALDPENQAVVLDTINKAKAGRTTVMVTHKLPVMKMCDRILVVHEGEVKEQGTYEELMRSKGVFASLASGGEWVGE